MIIGGSRTLDRQKEVIDALNVFPVPDGDTGTNMSLTMQSAAKEVSALVNPNVTDVAAAASMGSLMGARGNSGVILSQLFRGFAKGLEGRKFATGKELALALQTGVDTAYKAVMKPVEGTILTVSRDTAKAAVRAAKQDKDILQVLEAARLHGKSALARTPELLPTLKEAGVVDAGGQGFLTVIEGWIASLGNEEIESMPVIANQYQPATQEITSDEIVFQYCTEFILKGRNLQVERIKADLIGNGDCLLVVGEENVVKIHIHTNSPGHILDYATNLGSLHQVQIHNMREQSEARAHAAKNEAQQNTAEKEMGIIAVAVGQGLIDIFRSLGVDAIVQGGQTMNPSTEDLVSAIKQVKAKRIFVLPNNGNIILAAQQAQTLVDKEVHVVATKSIPQGIAAVLAFNPEATFAENMTALDHSFGDMKSGEVTYAVRNSQFDGVPIKSGDMLGLIEGRIALSGHDALDLTVQLIDKMGGSSADLITVFYGQEIDEQTAKLLENTLKQKFTAEVEVHSGGQPLYYYLISVE
ncbi:MAG TPA: DAK2 domain-containing protein [Desulfobacteria bacterium]|nr:DAK2 domain-containing protein [Desulfobacteria bacterium]